MSPLKHVADGHAIHRRASQETGHYPDQRREYSKWLRVREASLRPSFYRVARANPRAHLRSYRLGSADNLTTSQKGREAGSAPFRPAAQKSVPAFFPLLAPADNECTSTQKHRVCGSKRKHAPFLIRVIRANRGKFRIKTTPRMARITRMKTDPVCVAKNHNQNMAHAVTALTSVCH